MHSPLTDLPGYAPTQTGVQLSDNACVDGCRKRRTCWAGNCCNTVKRKSVWQTQGLAAGHASSMVTSTAMPPVNSSLIRLLLEQEAGVVSTVCVAHLHKLAEAPCSAILVTSMTGV